MGDTVTLNMGFRVYDSPVATRARTHRDYKDIKFELLKATPVKRIEPKPAVNAAALSLASAAVAALSLMW